MGLRFRKSFRVAPGIRVNLNAKSTSVTFGKKGLHYTMSSSGRKTASVGIPGTGLSYSATKSAKKKQPSQHIASKQAKNLSSRNRGCLVPFLIFLFTTLGIASLTTIICLNAPIPQTTNDLVPTEIVTESELETEILTTMYTTTELNVRSGPGIEYDILTTLQAGSDVNVINLTNDWSEIRYNNNVAFVSTKYLTDNYDTYIETQKPQQTDNAESSEPMVWISQSGSKYHRNSSCSGMKGPSQIPLSEAQQRGKSPCKKCY